MQQQNYNKIMPFVIIKYVIDYTWLTDGLTTFLLPHLQGISHAQMDLHDCHDVRQLVVIIE